MKRKRVLRKIFLETGLLILLSGLLLSGCGVSTDSNGNGASPYADSYWGTWTDASATAETGSWEFTVDANGNINGTVATDEDPDQSHAASGTVDGLGYFEFKVAGNWKFIMSGQINIGSQGKSITDAQVTGEVNGSATGENYVKFAVISDPHYYDTDLGTTGQAFEAYLFQDRKLLRESPAILEATIDQLLASGVTFVLISGDLTKDGSLSGHQKFAAAITRLLENGIKVYVVPGNHDLNNPHAVAYSGPDTTPVPNISPEEFTQIYKDFGYGNALERDPNSLSYVAEPIPGLWLLAIDSCIYQDNLEQGHPTTAGAFSAETLNWLLEKLQEASDKGKKVIGMMHHGLVEHYTGQSVFFAEYVINDWTNVADQLTRAGLKIVFTGHYHAQDMTQFLIDDGDSSQTNTSLFDIETGSLVTYPVPLRTVSFGCGTQRVKIKTGFVSEIDYDTGGTDFRVYAKAYLESGLSVLVPYALIHDFGVPEEKAIAATPDGVMAFVSHYSGDEAPTPEVLAKIAEYMADPDMANPARLMGTLWTDLPPADNNSRFDLTTGEIQ